MLTGTIINALAILAGSAVGIGIVALGKRKSSDGKNRVLDRIQKGVLTGVALCVIYIGISGSLKGENTLVAILSMALGAVIGEALDLDRRMRSLGDWLQKKVEKRVPMEAGAPPISDGFISASLIFCIGAMAVVGSLENGLTGQYDTLKAKALIDGVGSVVFASSMGIGVAFSAVAVFLYQGAISALSSLIAPALSDAVIAEMTCVGSLLIVASGLNMLKITDIKLMNFVPAIFLPIGLCLIM